MPPITFTEHGYLNGELPADCVSDCSHQGPCDSDVEYWVNHLHLDEALEPHKARAIRYLRDYGAWEDLDTADSETLAQRILWTACCDVHETGEPWIGLCH